MNAFITTYYFQNGFSLRDIGLHFIIQPFFIKQKVLFTVLLKEFIQYKLTPLSSIGIDQQNPHKEEKAFTKFNKINGIPFGGILQKSYFFKTLD